MSNWNGTLLLTIINYFNRLINGGELRSKAWHRISASDKENIQTRRRCKVLAGIMSNDPV